MPENRNRHGTSQLLNVIKRKLVVVAIAGAAVALGTVGPASAATGQYAPPPPPVGVPGGYTAVVTSVDIGPAGGTIGPIAIDGAVWTVTIPAGAFPTTVVFTLTAPTLGAVPPVTGDNVVTGAGIIVGLNGADYPGTFLKPVTATAAASTITAASDVEVWNGSAFVTDAASADTTGSATVSFDSDPEFAIDTPKAPVVTKVPVTVPVTGEPFLGEGILAGGLLLLGSGGILFTRRRRRARA